MVPQAAAAEAREDARALATQLQTEEGRQASMASQLQVKPALDLHHTILTIPLAP